MEGSVQMEADGYVIVSKNGLIDDDEASIASDRSSLCLVDDPKEDPLLYQSDGEESILDEGKMEEDQGGKIEKSKPGNADPAVLDSDASEAETLMLEKLEVSSKAGEIPPPIKPQAVAPKKEPKYACQRCSVDLAVVADTIWEGYMGANLPAVLLKSAKNTEPESASRQQQLSTGIFLVQDVKCRNCTAHLGWTYLKTFTAGQEYKVGTTIVQRSALRKVD